MLAYFYYGGKPFPVTCQEDMKGEKVDFRSINTFKPLKDYRDRINNI